MATLRSPDLPRRPEGPLDAELVRDLVDVLPAQSQGLTDPEAQLEQVGAAI